MAEAAIDHIIILLPHADIVNPPSWLTDHFTISPGGRHADGKTENKLIILGDGSYIELIAFINDDQTLRKGHWWDKDYGIVDFALTSQAGRFDRSITNRLQDVGSKITFLEPQRGGRTRPDGVEMLWEVTFPSNVERGRIPFWCHDITERERRVPVSAESTTHPSGATGVAALVLHPPRDMAEDIGYATAAILNQTTAAEYHLASPIHNEALASPVLLLSDEPGPAIELRLRVHTKAGQDSISHKIGGSYINIEFVTV